MADDSSSCSLIWDSTSPPHRFQSSSLSHIPNCYDLTLIAPIKLLERKRNSHATILQLPPLKLRSTLTWHSSDEELRFAQSNSSGEQELTLMKQKYDRLRASLSVRTFVPLN